MNDATPPFRVGLVEFDAARDALHAIREEVFVREQNVPAELERDALDAVCTHALARSLDGTPIGTARLTPWSVTINTRWAWSCVTWCPNCSMAPVPNTNGGALCVRSFILLPHEFCI